MMNRLRALRVGAPASAAVVGALCGGYWSDRHRWSEARAEAPGPDDRVFKGVEEKWYPNITTKHWHFYRGKMNPNAAKSLKLFKCADTPIADEIANYLGVKVNKMHVKNFADGETSVLVDEGVRGHRVYIVCSTTNVDRLMELLLSISAMRRASAKSITAVIPFYGYARQDRMHKGREPVAAADIARMLEVMGVDHVVTVDLHSAQIEGFFKPEIPVDNLQAYPVGAVYFSEMHATNPIVIAPHSSAVNRAVLFRDILSRTIDEFVPLAFVVRKHRLDDKLPGELVGEVDGRDCIIIDNLVDTGSTLVKTAQVLKSHGAKSVSAFCVHGRFSGEAAAKLQECDELDLLVTTNTIPMDKSTRGATSKIVTLSVAPFIAEVISCIHTKSSIIQIVLTRSDSLSMLMTRGGAMRALDGAARRLLRPNGPTSARLISSYPQPSPRVAIPALRVVYPIGIRGFASGQSRGDVGYELLKRDFRRWLRKEVALLTVMIVAGVSGVYIYQNRENAPSRQVMRQLDLAAKSAKDDDRETALKHCLQAYSITKATNPQDRHLFELAFAIAAQFETLGKIDSATRYYLDAVGALPYVRDSTTRERSRLVVFDRIAQCYQDRGERRAAENYYRQAMDCYESHIRSRSKDEIDEQMKREIPAVLFNYGQFLTHQRRWADALLALRLALQLADAADVPEENKQLIRKLLESLEVDGDDGEDAEE
ncbi:hypothetical protein Poli38472_014227 [Pythium oligandrum]|uniref:ribose-phosphate diphosphokinase n=1 Tax=Pythium oligandrum TaxID=41045 RepID=A0A8K1FHP4_PYTOL|nr:hypothetical protein Poli38472_014227 [Pythium oligandrum]|eukprot:TMW64110.1 hypothetical protein Poli38472_014227 [Pythium oligandrum]